MSINANTSVLEYERLTAERAQARLARKARNRARYERRYARRMPYPRMIRVSDIVTITIGPLWSVRYPLDSLGLVGVAVSAFNARCIRTIRAKSARQPLARRVAWYSPCATTRTEC